MPSIDSKTSELEGTARRAPTTFDMPSIDPKTEQEYWAAKRAVALVDRSSLGRIEMTGADALDLLHRLSTQDLAKLREGGGAATVLTTDKGRILDLLTVYHLGDHLGETLGNHPGERLGDKLLLLTAPEHQGAVLAWLDRYTFSEDSRAVDVTASTALLAFLGPRSTELAGRLAGRPMDGMALFHLQRVMIAATQTVLARAPEPGGGFHLFVPDRSALSAVREAVVRAGDDLGLQLIGPGVYDMLRVEAGIPTFGRELSEQYNPLEARLNPFISFTKGCYIGQEVVARLDAYNKVQKYLSGLALPAGEAPPTGTPLLADGKEAGFVTSSAMIPGRAAPVALGYVRSQHAAPGTILAIETANGPAPVTVVALPF